MKTEVIGKYLTKTGVVAFEVFRETFPNGHILYRYNGKFGAGCGALDDIRNTIQVSLQNRRGIQVIQAI